MCCFKKGIKMAQKRTQYVKTTNGLEKQLFASAADIVELAPINGLDAENVQDAIEQLTGIASTGGVTGVKGSAETEYRQGQVSLSPANIGLGNVTNDAQVKRTEMGANGGVATLDSSGKVPSSQLPSYVDDVLEYARLSAFPNTGESGKIYVAQDTGITYRWSGTTYTEISESLALGETESTAYAGSKGKANADNIASLTQRVSGAEGDILNIKNGTTKAGKAETADKLTTARTIAISGDATGEISFDGSEDKTLSLTLSNSGVAAGTYSVVSVDQKGRVTAGNQIVEWGNAGQSAPSSSLAIGGIFFQLVQ